MACPTPLPSRQDSACQLQPAGRHQKSSESATLNKPSQPRLTFLPVPVGHPHGHLHVYAIGSSYCTHIWCSGGTPQGMHCNVVLCENKSLPRIGAHGLNNMDVFPWKCTHALWMCVATSGPWSPSRRKSPPNFHNTVGRTRDDVDVSFVISNHQSPILPPTIAVRDPVRLAVVDVNASNFAERATACTMVRAKARVIAKSVLSSTKNTCVKYPTTISQSSAHTT